VAGLNGVGAALVLLGFRLLARARSTTWSSIAVCCSVAGAVTAALSIDWFSWRAQGIDPEHTSQGAMSHAMLALQAQLVAVVVVMTIYLAAARRGGW
jgi:hypothetical protein